MTSTFVYHVSVGFKLLLVSLCLYGLWYNIDVCYVFGCVISKLLVSIYVFYWLLKTEKELTSNTTIGYLQVETWKRK